MSEPSAALVAWCTAALLLGGTVKGLLGFGIPLVSVSLMSVVITVPQAVALISVAIVLANVLQSLQGGYIVITFRRHGALIAAMVAGTLAGARLLAGLDSRLLAGILGLVVASVAASQLIGRERRVALSPDRWGPAVLAGGLGGVLGGMAALFGPPILVYLVALRVPKDEFVGTIATVYLVGAGTLLVALTGFGTVGAGELLWSAGASAPVLAGMALGTWLRGRVSEAHFRRVLLVTLLLVGLSLMWKALA